MGKGDDREKEKRTTINAWDYYREKGFPVFPVGQDKQAVVAWKTYQEKHPTDAEIAKWKKTKYNIGVVTGPISGILVVDADSAEAVEELERLNKEGIKVPFCTTPRGGRHYYVKHHPEIPRNDKGRGKNEKVDVRSGGGMVVAPPSETKVGVYEWNEELNLDTVPIPFIPKRWLYLLHPLVKQRRKRLPDEKIRTVKFGDEVFEQRWDEWDIGVFEAEGPRLTEGRRDDDIFEMACAMRRKGWTRKQTEELAVSMWEKAEKGKRPFTKEDALKKVESAWKRPLRDKYKGAGEGTLFIPLSTVTPRAVEWLWYNRIPYGCYSAVGGDPGDGKSIALTDICAKITTGANLPDNRDTEPSGSIIYIVAEDNMSDTVRVRAEDARANLEKFIVSTGEKPGGGFFSIVDSDDLASLEAQITAQRDVQLLIFDPITTFLAGLRTNDEVEVRAALAPLNRLAEKYGIAVIGVGHLNKDEAKRALYRLSGSIAFVAVARTVWLVKKDEEGTDRRFFSPLKHNILKDPTTLSFKITGPLGRPIVEWEDEPVDVTCVDLLADEDTRERRSALLSARIFLDEFLPSGEEKLQTEIMREALTQGHKKRTMERAKDQLGGIRAFQRERQWFWERR